MRKTMRQNTDNLIHPGVPGLTLLIDGNNSLARAGHAFSELTGPDGRPSGALFGTIKEIQRIARLGKVKSVILCKDRGRPTFRVDAVNKHAEEGNGYKAHRAEKRDAAADKIHENYLSQLDYCHRLMKPFGVHVVSAQNWEADDVIGSFVYSYPDEKFTILSGDHDMWQLCLRGAKVYNPNKLEYVETPDQAYVLCRAVSGDKSDNIPGIRGVGEKTFYKIVEDYGLKGINVPRKFCKALKNKTKSLVKIPAAVTKILEGKSQLADYYLAMHLKNSVAAIETLEVHEGKWNDIRAKKFCKKLGFKSIELEWATFSKIFTEVDGRSNVDVF
jgi:5'-3' exonuclease